MSAGPRRVRFGPHEADLSSGELFKHGVRLRLAGQPFAILAVLLERPGEVVTREELKRRLWSAETFVDFDHGLNAAMNKLREALGDAADAPRYIETLPRRGYRFIAPAEPARPAPPFAPDDPAAPPASRGRAPLAVAGSVAAALALVSVLVARFVGAGEARPPAVADAGTVSSDAPRAAPRVAPAAYQAFLRGRHFQTRSLPSSEKAVPWFREAIRIAPDFALAHARLAEAEAFGHPASESLPRAKAEALQALELDPRLPQAHTALGLVHTFWDWDWNAADASFRRALELDPSSSEAHFRYAHVLAAQGRVPEAIAHCETALERDPLSIPVGHYLGRLHYFARDRKAAVAQLEKTLELDPVDFWTNFFLGIVYLDAGLESRSVPFQLRSLALGGVPPEALARLQGLYEREGYDAFENAILAGLKARESREPASCAVALRLARRGEKSAALDWLERAFEAHTRDLVYLAVDPCYAPLKDEPRYRALLAKMRL